MGDDSYRSWHPMPPWEAGPGPEEDPYHIWAPRPLQRSIRWQPAPSGDAGEDEEASRGRETVYEIFLDQRSLEAMHAHLWGAPANDDPFGYLVGDLCLDPDAGRHYVIIESAIPSATPLQEGEEAITAEAHRTLLRAVKRRRRGVVAGWYRRQRVAPPLLSERDERTHQEKFGQPWQVALVLVTDPQAPAGACFAPLRDGDGALSRSAVPFYELVGFDSLRARGVRRSRIEWSNVVTDEPVVIEPLPRPEMPSEEPAAGAEPRGSLVAADAPTEAEAQLQDVAPVAPEEVQPPLPASVSMAPKKARRKTQRRKTKRRKTKRKRIRPEDAREPVARVAEVAAVLLAAGSVAVGARNLFTGAASIHLRSATAHPRAVASPPAEPNVAAAPSTGGAEARPERPSSGAGSRREAEWIAATPILRRIDRLGLGLQSVVNRYEGVATAFDRKLVGCSELRTAYVAVEQGWLTYAARGRSRYPGRLPPTLAERDRDLYLRVGEIDRHFTESTCERP